MRFGTCRLVPDEALPGLTMRAAREEAREAPTGSSGFITSWPMTPRSRIICCRDEISSLPPAAGCRDS